METFLSETLRALAKGPHAISDYTLILPSKRAGGFLNQVLMEQAQEVYFAPTIYSIEDFIAQVSGIDIMNPTQVLLEAYKVYTQNQKLSFSDYLLWAEPLLNDFNELDRNLVVPEDFFGYLSQVKALERWELKTPATDLMKDYLKFWEGLLPFYNEFSAQLLQQGSAYQGLVYRRAAEDLSHYLSAHGDKPHVFIGFNALNPAEELIIQEMLAQGNNQIFWDMDECFVRDERHSVSQFVRTYLDQWPYYRGRSSQGGAVFSRAFEQKKAFNLIESNSDQGQVQAMGQILRDLPVEKAHKTAIVLADESLLIPVLYAIPKEIKNINITMGYPLKAYPGVWFFESLLQWHKSSAKRIHHSLLLKILTHPFGQLLLSSSHEVVTSVQKNHQLFVALDDLKAMVPEHQHPTLELIFSSAERDSGLLQQLITLINQLISHTGLSPIDRIGVQKLSDLMQELKGLARDYGFIDNVNSIAALYDHLLSSQSLDFEGDAYHGLQVMGMLETRVLDFEHIIMVSVNEGILPQGKSSASFITYDMKKEFGLPLHTDKDAIYAYHFFRLLSRAKQVHFIYKNSQTGLSVGEPSRFLRLLALNAQTGHTISKQSAAMDTPPNTTSLATYKKTPEVMQRMAEIMEQGLSPSSLGQYIRDPEEFYLQRIIKVPEERELADSIAANLLGEVVHESIKQLYEPHAGFDLTLSKLEAMEQQIPQVVMAQFETFYNLNALEFGKNLIVTEVVKRYCQQLIDWDRASLNKGHQISLIEIETKHEISLDVPGIANPVRLRGTVDRLDRCNGVLRVIDYKTGKVNPPDLNLDNWDELIQTHKKEKVFQLLTYAYMQHKKQDTAYALGASPTVAGIISFKNFGHGLMTYTFKSKSGGAQKHIDTQTLSHYEQQLFALINELNDPAIDFVAKAEGE